ncbi:N-6 DNA methylase [Flavobacterium aquidurense]|uniref:HsdM family class I SAM-dependent methyltransferase n=1 Tax=Flavobacterium aquidurense TaxID=362413 RepID=UPI00285CCE96|nr:N-6 DNA methylase [Flavobacterium aquidurense]MDR7371062.1 type I restriction-modification system DNA methylase subunit [Flavobacterium aquidurense]
MANERKTDFFIGKLLDQAKIEYTPNGSDIKEVNDALKTASKKGTGRIGFPEFTAIVKDYIIVIENKADINKQAHFINNNLIEYSTDTKSLINYAENGALHYAKQIVEKTSFKKVFAFGCSGDEKHHTIRPIYVDLNGYKPLDKVDNFINFSKQNIDRYYREQVLGETPQEELELEDILAKSKELHEALRNYGQLGDSEKPLVVSAILLALSEKTFNMETLIGDEEKTDGQILYDYISTYMNRVKVTPSTKKEKVLGQFNMIKDRALLNQIDARLKKTPLKYFTEYLEKNILKSVKANTAEDVLGRFYGEFISFSGGDGQTLGVVLTPSHITELFCDLVDLKPTDQIMDPCCGTSGFLIAGMHKMLEQAKDDKEIERIKQQQLHGIEIREDMFSIATTNMILRGDGKSNLENKDFLKIPVEELREKKLTVGFINPPYSQAKNKETVHLSEISFIKHLLDCLADNARCVAIVPQSTMVGKTKEDKKIKARILEQHTLEGVLTLNKNTFYGVGTNACIVVFTAHQPHPPQKRCKFINFEDDGYVVSKHIGLTKTQRAISQKQLLLDIWNDVRDTETKYMVKTIIEADDEWLHSFYYFNDEVPKIEDFEKSIGDYLSFEFNMIMQGKGYLFNNENE